MKTFKNLLLPLIFLASQISLAGEIPFQRDFSYKFPHKSDGYRVGYLKDASVKDSPFLSVAGRNFVQVCEGELNVGNLTDAVYGQLTKEANPRNKEAITLYNMVRNLAPSEIEQIDNDETDSGNLIRISPWYFNISTKDCSEIQKLSTLPVLIHYRQPYRNVGVQNPYETTTYRFINAFPVRNKPFNPSFVEDKPGFVQSRSTMAAGQSCGLTSSDCGARVGQIIKVSRKGRVVNSWEMQLAQGKDGTGTVLLMSIKNSRIARWAILAMASGLQVKVHYNQIDGAAWRVINPDAWFKDTSLIVRGMELMPLAGVNFKETDYKLVPEEVLSNEKINLDNYLWDQFVDSKTGVQSLREQQIGNK